MISRGLVICRLPWRHETGYGGVYRNCRIDVAQALAGKDIREAVSFLEEELDQATFIHPAIFDWVDELASNLRSNARIRVAEWARAKGITREHVSRCFASVYKASPAQFRFELNARAAWLRTIGTQERLSKIAADLGFSDQAHMSRAVKALSGLAPARWRSPSLQTLRGVGSSAMVRMSFT
jgi:AraC-like DNA-binding protein